MKIAKDTHFYFNFLLLSFFTYLPYLIWNVIISISNIVLSVLFFFPFSYKKRGYDDDNDNIINIMYLCNKNALPLFLVIMIMIRTVHLCRYLILEYRTRIFETFLVNGSSSMVCVTFSNSPSVSYYVYGRTMNISFLLLVVKHKFLRQFQLFALFFARRRVIFTPSLYVPTCYVLRCVCVCVRCFVSA